VFRQLANSSASTATMRGVINGIPRPRVRRRMILGLLLTLLATTSCLPAAGISEVDSASSPDARSDELDKLLARVPNFPPAPDPVPVTLPRRPNAAAYTARIPTDHPVAFITVDDGRVKDRDASAVMNAAQVPITAFLTTNTISDDKQYFADLAQAGLVIEAHTVSHPRLSTLTYEQQRQELCQSAELLEDWYGQRPLYFRPPYGDRNEDTLRAAWSCGYRAGFGWRAVVADGEIRYQDPTGVLQPGDIILLHFRSNFALDLVVALEAIKAAGLTPARLTDYVTVESSHEPKS